LVLSVPPRLLVMEYKLHTARTCGVADPFPASKPSGIARRSIAQGSVTDPASACGDADADR
jgi:hypothetical protein